MSVSADKPTVALIIDDEVQIRRLLRLTLEAHGYKVYEAADGQTGLLEAGQRRPDVVLLDLGLPDLDGLTVLKRLREWSRVPVVVLSVRDREEDKIAALDHGADDYVTKPFSTGELLARLRVAQRHTQPAPEAAVFRSGEVEVDFVNRGFRNTTPFALNEAFAEACEAALGHPIHMLAIKREAPVVAA